jgi:hypothetical protein
LPIEPRSKKEETFLAEIADLVEALKQAGHDPYGRPATPRDDQGYPTGEPATQFQLWCRRCARPYLPWGASRIASISPKDPCERGPADRIGIRDTPAENPNLSAPNPARQQRENQSHTENDDGDD